jgi:phytoene desaturase
MKSVVVIGAGLGGLAAAVRLAHAGFPVTVLERNEYVGGKMGTLTLEGFTFDTGPSLLTMPFIVQELFASVGRKLEDYLQLDPVEPLCRYYWPDGSTLDASSVAAKMQQALARLNTHDAEAFPRFLDHGRALYKRAAPTFLFQPFSSLDWRSLLRNVQHLPNLFKIDAGRTYNAAVASFFHDARVRQLFNRFATYNGSSPYRAPATLTMIPAIEFHFGGWYIRGGMYKLAQALERVANELGVRIITKTTVARIEVERRNVRSVITDTGEVHPADIVISNADAKHTETLLDPESRTNGRYRDPSLSGFVLLIGVKKRFPQLAHHTIFFSRDYRAEFDALCERGILPDDPTIYVCTTALSDLSHAPEGCSNLFILVNAPPLRSGIGSELDWQKEAPRYRSVILQKLSSFGVAIHQNDIAAEATITPNDFAARFNALHGALYGMSSNSRMAAFLRPGNRSRQIGGLYFAGGSVHPGGGIPLVLLSGKHAVDLIQKKWQKVGP